MLPLLNEYRDKMLADGSSPRTVDQNTAYCRYFAKWYGSDNARKVTRKDIQAYKVYMMTEHKTRFWGKKLANSSIANRLYAVKGYFKYLEEKKVIFLDPTTDLSSPSVKKFANTDLLTEREVQDLIQKPDTKTLLGLRDRLIFELFYTTALRSGELCKLKLSDIDMKKKIIYPSRLKGGRECEIPIISSTYQVLDKYLTEGRPGIIEVIKKPDIPELLMTKRGNPMDPGNMNHLFQKYRNGKKHIHPHALRHSCATHMLKNGADIRNIQTLLGHHRLETTQGYTKLVIKDLKIIHDKHHPRERYFKKNRKSS